MIGGDQVWVKGYARGPHQRRAHSVTGFRRSRPGGRRKPEAPPADESVAPCERAPQQYSAHGVRGYWRARPIR